MPPPTITVVSSDGTFTIGDSIDLTCTVSADNVDEHAMAVVEWRSNITVLNMTTLSVGESFTHTLHDIRLSEAGEYFCSGYINSSNEFFYNSIVVLKGRIVNLTCKLMLIIDNMTLFPLL